MIVCLSPKLNQPQYLGGGGQWTPEPVRTRGLYANQDTASVCPSILVKELDLFGLDHLWDFRGFLDQDLRNIEGLF